MDKLFKVIKSTASSKGGFVNTIEAETVSTVFGAKKTTKHRLSIKTDDQLEVGAEQVLDLDNYRQETYKNEYTNNAGEKVIGSNTWLHEKVESTASVEMEVA